MATKQTQKSGSAQDATSDVAIDVAANDLVEVGKDTLGYTHYYDRQRDRVIVTTETADEYSRDGSILVRRSLVADGSSVDEIVTGVDGELKDYVRFVAGHVEDRDWEVVTVDFLDFSELLSGVVGGR